MIYKGLLAESDMMKIMQVFNNYYMSLDGEVRLVDNMSGMNFLNERPTNSKSAYSVINRNEKDMGVNECYLAFDKVRGKRVGNDGTRDGIAEGECRITIKQYSHKKYSVKLEMGEPCKGESCVNFYECLSVRSELNKLTEVKKNEDATTGAGRAKTKGS